jgi:hypothetical protein
MMANHIKAAVLGAVVWGLVLILMRLLGASVFSAGNPWLVVFYIACFPAGVVFTLVMRALMNLPMREMLKPMVIFGIVALMLDGLSFAFTDVYGVGEHEVYSAAFLLWGPGVFLLCALWLVSRAEAESK